MGINIHRVPKCVVLLAVYNGMKYLNEQVESIFKQIGVDLTILISVDASLDGSEAWVDTLLQRDPRVVILPHGGKFGSAAKNFFRLLSEVDVPAFDYIAFADQDDYWYSDKLLRATCILNDQNYDAYSSNVTAFWPGGKRMLVNKAQVQKQWDFIFQSAGPGCTYVMNKKSC